LLKGTVSLLPAGVADVTGSFDSGETVEIADAHGAVIARGLAMMSSDQARRSLGRRTADLEEGTPQVVVHRDDLVLLPR
jgi:glutamate 5-kinase